MIDDFLSLLFPKVCAGCKAFLLKNEDVICTVCRHDLPLSQFHLTTDNDAFKKFYGRIPVEFVAPMLLYHKKGIVQELVHSLKYRGHQEIGTFLGNWYASELIDSAGVKNIDTIIPVPLHQKRLRKRGFNQVTTFATALSNNLNIEFEENILFRKTNSKTQSQKKFDDRIEVQDTIFDVIFEEKHHNKHFLLIDDVMTTGSTIEQCARAVLKIPGAKVSIVTMAFSSL
jgi:ComF family protein